MRQSILLLALVFIGACTQNPDKAANAHELSRPVIRIIEGSIPLYLDRVLDSAQGSLPSPKLDRALQGMVEDFYFNQCAGDSSETLSRMADALLFTVQMPGRTEDYYLMVMQHVPQGFVTGRLVKWDTQEERITGGPADVRLSGMYNARNGRLERSNLKAQFKITGPELEILDTLGKEAIVVRRLWHNGTFNSMERSVLCLTGGKVDTVLSRLSPM